MNKNILNNIIIEWNNSENISDNQGIISHSEISDALNKEIYKNWKDLYIVSDDDIESNNSDLSIYFLSDAKICIYTKKCIDKRGGFKMLYEMITPYSESFFNISKKLLRSAIEHGGTDSAPRAKMNYYFHNLLFGFTPRKFNKLMAAELRPKYEMLYDLLADSEKNTINKIHKNILKGNISSDKILKILEECKYDDGAAIGKGDVSILSLIQYLKPFLEDYTIGKYLW